MVGTKEKKSHFIKSFRGNCKNRGKYGHTNVRCKHIKQIPRTDKKGTKKIWVPKQLIISITNLLYRKRSGTKLVVSR